LFSAPYTSRQTMTDSQLEEYSTSKQSFTLEGCSASKQSCSLRQRKILHATKGIVCASFSYLLCLLLLLPSCSLLRLVLRTLHKSTTNQRLPNRKILRIHQPYRLQMPDIPHPTNRIVCARRTLRNKSVTAFAHKEYSEPSQMQRLRLILLPPPPALPPLLFPSPSCASHPAQVNNQSQTLNPRN
jgi:hypothetical protein